MKKFFFTVFILTSFDLMSQVENQNFKTLNVIDNIEIREYPPAIFGGNENNQKIAMTAPVHIHQNNNEKSSTMRFVMPSEYKIDELSKPNDERIEIKKSVTKKYAAISYTGYNNSEKFKKYKSELQNVLDKKNVKTIGNPIYLGYDPPYKFWNRKNEVLIEIN